MATLRIFDNGGETLDRYTILPPRTAWRKYLDRGRGWEGIYGSAMPFHGIGGQCICVPGRHLGKRIQWADLPPDMQRFAKQSFPEFAP